MTITLRAGGWDLKIAPETGAAILHCRYDGQDMLRAYTADDTGEFEILNTGGFCLVPFSNRIEDGKLSYNGKSGVLALTHDKIPPHPIHGFGWQSAWDVTQHTDRSITLRHDYPAGPWPWAYRAQQHISISGDVMSHELSLTNMSGVDMPAGLGFHPYFPDAANARLTCKVGGVWMTREDGIPTAHQSVPGAWDFSDGMDVAGTQIDHVFTDAAPTAQINWNNVPRGLRIDSSANLPFAVIYTASPDGSFCYEPVSHMTDAINRAADAEDTGLIDLPPGQTLRAQMRYTVI